MPDSSDHSPANAIDILRPDARSPVIVLCDHASYALPVQYGTLGLPASELDRHIGWDIGAAGVTRALSDRLEATAVLSRWSRLLIDLNRGFDDPTLIMRLSDGAVIPGNRHLDDAERERRIARCYRPYHGAIAGLIDARLAAGRTTPNVTAPVLLSIHSFTPVWRGSPRPWHAAVLWDKDPRLAMPLIDGLSADPTLVVGDNEPYHGKLQGDTLWQHGTRRGLAHAIVEIRQDLIATEAGQLAWADRLGAIMARMLADTSIRPTLDRVEHWGSWTDGESG
jgi:predicted N-formylglutamate amidohydrolase